MKRILVISAVIASIVSCSKGGVAVEERGDGSISLRMALERSKAAMTEQELLDSALVRIYMADFSGLVREYKAAELPEKIYLPANDYRLDVLMGDAAFGSTVSWEQKSYKGTSPFTVRPGTDTTMQITCKLWNATVCVDFPDSIGIIFGDSYTFSVSPAENGEPGLVFDSSKDGQDGYVVVSGQGASLFWNFSGIHQIKGYRFTKTGEITDVKPGARYTMSPKYTSREGTVQFELSVNGSYSEVDDILIFDPKSSGMSPSADWEIWSRHATVHADVDEGSFPEQDKIKFEYTSDGGATWLQADAARVSEGAYAATLTELTGSTDYRCRLSYDGQAIDEGITFTTFPEKQLPNWDFETVSNDESGKYKLFYDPSSSDPELKTKFWDNGNSASTSFTVSGSGPICLSDTDVPKDIGSKLCAKLMSRSIMGNMAAGNLFTGEFAGTHDLKYGMVNFGRLWPTGARPSAVKFWFRYVSGVVDYGDEDIIPKGVPDTCSIKVAIGNWPNKNYGGTYACPLQVDTGDKETFKRSNFHEHNETIAYCYFETAVSTEWTQFTLPFTYKTMTELPTHIVFSAAASKYGDYYKGSSSSELYIDNVELLYD